MNDNGIKNYPLSLRSVLIGKDSEYKLIPIDIIGGMTKHPFYLVEKG